MLIKQEIRRLFMPFCSVALLAMASPAFAAGGHGDAHATADLPKSPAAAMKLVVEGNKAFTGHHDSKYFEPYQNSQVPTVTVVSCSDSRVHTSLFGMDPNNNIFIIRNIGNQLATAEGSVDYGVRHLPCKVLLVMGHSSCGAVKASMGDYSGETDGIKRELDSLKPVVNADKSSEPFATRWGMDGIILLTGLFGLVALATVLRLYQIENNLASNRSSVT